MEGRLVLVTWFYFVLFILFSISTSSLYQSNHIISALVLLWHSLNALYFFVACLTNNPHLLGKNRKTGKIDNLFLVALLPTFVGIWTVWFIRKSTSKEPVYDEIAKGIYVGKLPFLFTEYNQEKHNLPVNIGMVVDLTAEFNQTITGRKYHCCLSLDALHPPDSVTDDILNALKDAALWNIHKNGGIFIHCANGHGRSAMMAAMILVVRGIAKDFDEAYSIIKSKRRKVNVRPQQRAAALRILEKYINTFSIAG